MRRSLLLLAALGCGTATPAARPPSGPSLVVDPLPGSVAELEAMGGMASLEKAAAIHHALGQPREEAAALRRTLPLARSADRLRVGRALALALDAQGTFAEADALRRHLVCPAKYGEAGEPLPQDHDEAYWDRWETAHPTPLDLAKSPQPTEETRYVALYEGCTEARADAELAASTWVELAEAHRARDPRGGPFAVLRAVEAFQKAVAVAPPTGPAMRRARLGLGQALHAHERYHAAALELVRALSLCEQTHGCATAERREALLVLADSLVIGDFEGPPPDAPVIARPDVLDVEPTPARAAAKLRVGLDRALDPALVPQTAPFAPEVLAAVAQTFADVLMDDNAIAAFGELRVRYPTHREIPRVLQAVARLRVRSATWMRRMDSVPSWLKGVSAWDDLEALVRPGSAWREANKTDREALAAADAEWAEGTHERADALLAAVRALAATAEGGSRPLDVEAARALFERARREARDSRQTIGQVALAELTWLVATGTVDPAKWNEAAGVIDDAQTQVQLADLRVRYEEKRWTESHGKEGLAPRSRELKPPLRAHPREELPPAIASAVAARDRLAHAVTGYPASVARREAAGLLFAYGQGDEASKRLAEDVAVTCKTSDGFTAFSLAAEVARASKNAPELKRLQTLNADPQTTCATTAEQVTRGRVITN